MLVYGGCLCDGNCHSHNDLPLQAGKGNGSLKPAHHIEYAKGTPMANLFFSLLDKMKVPPEKLGDSTGQLEHQSEI
jgi:hypothetical protein